MNKDLRPLWFALFMLTAAVASVEETLAETTSFEVIKNESIKISGKVVGRYFFVEFTTPAFVNPAESGYFISAFTNQQIPYYGQGQAVASHNLSCTMSKCSYALEAPITSVPYIVGMGSSHSLNTISASLNFTPGNAEGSPFNSTISVLDIGINSVIVSYEMPLGYKPIDSKSWVAIWQGEAESSVLPLGKADVNSLQSSGSQAINGLSIQSGATYTIGIFSGPKSNDIVAAVTIKVKAY